MEVRAPWNGFKQLSLKIATTNAEKNSFIKRIDTGSFLHSITIRMSIDFDTDVTHSWDVRADEEIEAFQTSAESFVIWDSQGYPYLIEDSKVMFMTQGVTMMCYNLE